jgi:hypothetical protein
MEKREARTEDGNTPDKEKMKEKREARTEEEKAACALERKRTHEALPQGTWEKEAAKSPKQKSQCVAQTQEERDTPKPKRKGKSEQNNRKQRERRAAKKQVGAPKALCRMMGQKHQDEGGRHSRTSSAGRSGRGSSSRSSRTRQWASCGCQRAKTTKPGSPPRSGRGHSTA